MTFLTLIFIYTLFYIIALSTLFLFIQDFYVYSLQVVCQKKLQLRSVEWIYLWFQYKGNFTTEGFVFYHGAKSKKSHL